MAGLVSQCAGWVSWTARARSHRTCAGAGRRSASPLRAACRNSCRIGGSAGSAAPPGEAPAFYHSWLLSPEGDGCRVAMDEAGVGPGAAAFRKADETRMHRGHQMWLATLKWVAEGR